MSPTNSRDDSVTKRSPLHPTERARAGVTAESLRAMNLSLALRHILAAPGQISRSGIAQATDITRATISRLVDELIGAGLVLELEPVVGARGRPAARLTPAPGCAVALGLEINVSAAHALLLDLTGEEIARVDIIDDFAGADPRNVMTRLGDSARDLLRTHLPESALYLGAGLALPGLVSETALALAPNLGWRDLPLDSLLAPIADLDPAAVANEADLAAFAVAHPLPGVPSGPATFIYVSGEVGVGAGLIVEHRPAAGAHGWAGEIGHVCADPAGPPCSCGATGCLEAYLGLRALAEHAGLDRTSTTQNVIDVARSDAPTALAALDEAGAALGRALSGVINATDIPLVLLGGNVAELSDWLIGPAMREIQVRVLQAPWTHPEIRVLPHSANLAQRGAALRILQRLVDDPIAWTS